MWTLVLNFWCITFVVFNSHLYKLSHTVRYCKIPWTFWYIILLPLCGKITNILCLFGCYNLYQLTSLLPWPWSLGLLPRSRRQLPASVLASNPGASALVYCLGLGGNCRPRPRSWPGTLVPWSWPRSWPGTLVPWSWPRSWPRTLVPWSWPRSWPGTLVPWSWPRSWG